MTEERKSLADKLFWWHRIRLSDDYITPGMCPHGTGDDINTRFLMPADLTGKTVLDIGAWDGLFSFEAEKRGGKVTAIDVYQNRAGQNANNFYIANMPFQLAKGELKSEVEFFNHNVEQHHATGKQYDVVLFYGVLYHVIDPLGTLQKVMQMCKPGGTVLIETAVAAPAFFQMETPLLQYQPNFVGDPTNQFYPNSRWMIEASKENGGIASLEYYDKIRATYKVVKV